MKKLWIAALAGVFCVPAFAQEEVPTPVQPEEKSTVEQSAKPERPEAFKQAREKQLEQLKASQEKMEKLVTEYNKMKAGKKKDAKKAEIAQAVAAIHEEQIAFKEKQLANFEQRVNKMKEELAKQSTTEAKQEWVDEHTDKLIAENGNLRVLFDKPKGIPGYGNKPGFKGGKHDKPGMHQKHPDMGSHKPGKRFYKPSMKNDESSQK